MNIAGKTNLGLVRKNNQDKYLIIDRDDEIGVFCVADGLGGHRAGEVASALTTEELKSFFLDRTKEDIVNHQDDIIKQIQDINRIIYTKSCEESKLSGMGTTLTLAIADKSTCSIFQIGDSRAYIINDAIEQVTKDHSLVQFMIDQGQITKEEGLTHPKKNIITRALGTDQSVQVDLIEVPIQTDDKILLCSDGLTNNVDDQKILQIVTQYDTKSAVDHLIDEANKNGGTDNITVVLYAGSR